MGNRDIGQMYVIVEPSVPHDMLIKLGRLIDRKKRKFSDRNGILNTYKRSYKNCEKEIASLKYAYDQGIIKGFFENDKGELWNKRIFIKQSMHHLTAGMTEREAVILLESLMFCFGWDFTVRIPRSWEAPEEERADFHDTSTASGRNDLEEFLSAGREAGETKERDNKSESGSEGGYHKERVEKNPKSTEKRDRGSLAKNRSDTVTRDISNNQDSRRKSEDVLKQEPEAVLFYERMTPGRKKVLGRALRGDVRSQCEIGDFYAERGSGHLDYREAIRWYEVSSERGYERAYYEMGKIYDMEVPELPGGKKKALEIYMELAQRGFPTAQCIIGMKYWLGDGVRENYGEAVSWLKKAAMQHHEAAIRNLADLYGSAGDRENAKKWYRIGASRGDWYCKEKLSKRR